MPSYFWDVPHNSLLLKVASFHLFLKLAISTEKNNEQQLILKCFYFDGSQLVSTVSILDVGKRQYSGYYRQFSQKTIKYVSLVL